MRRARALVPLAAALLAGSGVACGGDGGRGKDAERATGAAVRPDRPTDPFASRVNATCARHQARLSAIESRSRSTRDGDRFKALRQIGGILGRLGRELDRIRAPRDRARRYAKLISSLRSVARRYRRGAAELARGETAAGTSTIQAGVDRADRATQLANSIGLTACGG